MTRLNKCNLLKSKGYTYDPLTGKVYGSKGKEIKNENNDGYIRCTSFGISLLAHHFGWFWVYGNVDFEELHHINHNRKDNRISNLQMCSKIENLQNKKFKGITYNKVRNKWQVYLKTETKKKYKYIGLFSTEEEAKMAYIKKNPHKNGGFE